MSPAPAGTEVVGNGASAPAVDSANQLLSRIFGHLATANATQLKKVHLKLLIVPVDKKLTDLPEYSRLHGVATFESTPEHPRTFDDIRGAGGEQRGDDVIYAIAEEQLTPIDGHPSGYGPDHVPVHESGHVIYTWGLTDDQRSKVKAAYAARKADANAQWLAPGDYTSANVGEYFANSVAAYFSAPYSSGSANTYNPQWLKEHDPTMYAVLNEVFVVDMAQAGAVMGEGLGAVADLVAPTLAPAEVVTPQPAAVTGPSPQASRAANQPLGEDPPGTSQPQVSVDLTPPELSEDKPADEALPSEKELEGRRGCLSVLTWLDYLVHPYDYEDDEDNDLPPGCIGFLIWLTIPRALAGLLIAFGLGFGFGFNDYGAGTTIERFVEHVPIVEHGPSTPSSSRPLILGGSLCIQPAGPSSIIVTRFFTYTNVNQSAQGGIAMWVNGQPTQPITGRGEIQNGVGTIFFPINQFGTYANFNVVTGSGQTVPIGPMSSLFPFVVSSDNQPCAKAGAQEPEAPPSSGGSTSTGEQTITRTETLHTGGSHWSLLAIPGGLLLGGGLFLLSPPRRSRDPELRQPDVPVM